MKNGTLCKNVTDSLMIVMILLAVVMLIISYVTFDDEGYIVVHPKTEAEIDVESFLDDPYHKLHIKMIVGSTISVLFGFCGRKKPWLGTLVTAILFAFCLYEYANGFLRQEDFGYILLSAIGFAGSLVYQGCVYAEKRQAE